MNDFRALFSRFRVVARARRRRGAVNTIRCDLDAGSNAVEELSHLDLEMRRGFAAIDARD